MSSADAVNANVPALDERTSTLVRLAAVIAIGGEPQVREALAVAISRSLDAGWIEELILQSYLFAGFPRTLNAMREWRRLSRREAPDADEATSPSQWRAQGERTCASVYGPMYGRLRTNIAALHPALDEWMVIEGYGKVLSRPGLDLLRRELCIVAVCAVAKQDRQLQSHLHGALNVGGTPEQVAGALAAVADLLPQDERKRANAMLAKVVRGRDSETGSV